MKPLIVTALYDIGRQDWKTFNMSYHTYLTWMEYTLTLNCDLVIFTETKFESKIREMRSKVDPLNIKTTYIVNTIQDLEIYTQWFEKISTLMDSEEFKSKRHWDHVPEMNYPLYNIVMFNKVYFLRQASTLKPEHTHLIWVDAGGIRETIENPECWPNIKKLNSNKIMHFSHNVPFTVQDSEWHTLSQARNIQGGCLICPSYMIDWYTHEVNRTIGECISNRYIGSDEKIFDLTYLRNKNNIKLYQSDWREYYNWLGKE